MGKILIFDIDDTLIMHTKQKNDYYVKTIDKVIKIKSFKGKLVHKDVLV